MLVAPPEEFPIRPPTPPVSAVTKFDQKKASVIEIVAVEKCNPSKPPWPRQQPQFSDLIPPVE